MVKFGHYLLEAAEKSGIPVAEYFEYKRLKKQHIKDIVTTKEKEGHARIEQTYAFQEAVAEQISKIQQFTQKRSVENTQKLNALVAQVKSDQSKKLPMKPEYLEQANDLGEEYVRLSSFVAVNKLAIDKIVKKHDKHAAAFFRELFPSFLKSNALLQTSSYADQILSLSDLYAELRGENVEKAVAVGTNFERKSVKYWVHPQDAMTVIMFIIRYLPVYSFRSDKNAPRKCISDIKSTYYDNEKLYMYHTRIKREEGASLIRIRWYDDNDATLFVERKIHHESWVEDSSTKERFVLPGRFIDSYMAGQYTTEQFQQALVAKGKLKPDEIDYQKQLFEEVYQRLSQYELFPSVRTHYKRMAFQIPGDASVRVSLDLDVEMITEWLTPPGHWRSERVDEEITYNFPYAIMEVKLSGSDAPPWIEQLMASKYVEAVPKFSKFGHGTATLHYNRVRVVPYWFEQMDREIESIYKPTGPSGAEGSLYPDFRPLAYPSSTPQHPLDRLNVPTSISRKSSSERLSDTARDSSEDEGNSVAIPIKDSPSPPSPINGHAPKSSLRKRSVNQNRLPWWQKSESERTDKDTNRPKPVVAVRVKIEPKTYLANERTFLHWISISSLVAMMALAVIRRNPGSFSIFERIFGMLAFLVSLCYMGYALVTFHNRNKLIAAGQQVNFEDNRGPIILTLLLAVTVIVSGLAQLGFLGFIDRSLRA